MADLVSFTVDVDEWQVLSTYPLTLSEDACDCHFSELNANKGVAESETSSVRGLPDGRGGMFVHSTNNVVLFNATKAQQMHAVHNLLYGLVIYTLRDERYSISMYSK